MEFTLSDNAEIASRFINQTNRHVFLTGKAGTGKTTFLKHILANTHKKAAVVAPTGIAALNAGGTTIHSMFQLPFGIFVPQQVFTTSSNLQLTDRSSLIKKHHVSAQKRAVIRELELLIIDEVSMLRCDILDAMDAMMRHVRGKHHLSFGGVQVLFIGDLHQLPPIAKEEEWNILSAFYKSIHFFEARVLQENPPLLIELEKIHRQNNPEFISLLNNLRNNQLSKKDADLLNQFYKEGFRQHTNGHYITLTTHNYKANQINQQFLNDLHTTAFEYEAETKNDFPEHLFPLESKLILKKGAQVMFIKNDISGKQRYFNGKLATVKNLQSNSIEVAFEDGSGITVEKYTWQNKRFSLDPSSNDIKEEIIGEFIHYPIKLAWAITVHKSQGLTFDRAVLDIGDAFAPGQVYVALSRLRDLSGLVLTSKINTQSLLNDERIISYTSEKRKPADIVEQLRADSKSFMEYYLINCYDFKWLEYTVGKHLEEHLEKNKSKLKQKFAISMQDIHTKIKELKEHADKFIVQLKKISSGEASDMYVALAKRTADAEAYFVPKLKEACSVISAHIDNLRDEKKVKQYLAELISLEGLFFDQIKKCRKATSFCECCCNGESLTREKTLGLAEQHIRVTENTSEKTKEKKKKTEKGDSVKESTELFLSGKSISEIATLRNMASSTIEGHLAQAVASGKIKAHQLVAEEKITAIHRAAEKTEEPGLKPLKELLGDNYTYSDIKIAMACFKKPEA